MNLNIQELNTQIENLEGTLATKETLSGILAKEILETENKIAMLFFQRERAELSSFVISLYKEFADDEEMYQKVALLETLIKRDFSLSKEGTIPTLSDYLNYDFTLMDKTEKGFYLKKLPPEDGEAPLKPSMQSKGKEEFFMPIKEAPESYCDSGSDSTPAVMEKVTAQPDISSTITYLLKQNAHRR